MTPIETFRGQTVAVFGLGGSGLSTVQALRAGGAEVAAWDDSEKARDLARKADVPLVDLTLSSWSSYAALVLAPGVPLTHPVPHWSVAKAHHHGVPVIGDIELFCRERAARAPHSPFIAITGTNGKSTTTALIAHLLSSAGRDVAVGGNIGTAILDLPPPAADRFHVVECSSFQIDLAPSLAPSIGVLLNITPDHLDRHGTMTNYAAVKERLIADSTLAVVGVDDSWCRDIVARRDARRAATFPVSVKDVLHHGYWADGSSIVSRIDEVSRVRADLSLCPPLRGAHNAQNAAAALAVVSALGLQDDEIQRGLASFPGLHHRLEMVGYAGRALALNDSKATNADAAEKALLSFQSGVFWIAGGRSKEGGITSLAPLFDRVEKAYLIGEAAADFAATLAGHVPVELSGTLDQAIIDASRDANASAIADPVVLLSPACASYDQFKNFEERGDRFRTLIAGLPNFTPVGSR